MQENFFDNKVILITGATGLIGKALINYILVNNKKTTVIALVRDIEKAERTFKFYSGNKLKYIVGDVKSIKIEEIKIDYIIHAASQTDSKAFISEPVETIMTAILGTYNMLEVARMYNVQRFIYLSSMEVYGTPCSDDKINEDYATNIITMNVRSSYSESKRMCENICASYLAEYKIPTTVLRLTQTFGPGVDYYDKRVFAEFARCAIEGKNIILKTKGETKRSYLYIDDAIEAILLTLEKGEAGGAYNVANESTYCSIYEMATLVADKYSIKVEIEEDENIMKFGYAPTLHINLDTSKICKLGWRAKVGLSEMYDKMIEDMQKNKK